MIILGNDTGPALVAFVAARLAFEKILKSGSVDYQPRQGPAVKFEYATIDNVVAATNPALLTNNLLLTQKPEVTATALTIHMTIDHISGVRLDFGALAFPFKSSDPKDIAGLMTYLRRYQQVSCLNLSCDDDLDAKMIKEVKSDITQQQPRQVQPAPAAPTGFNDALSEMFGAIREMTKHGASKDDIKSLIGADPLDLQKIKETAILKTATGLIGVWLKKRDEMGNT